MAETMTGDGGLIYKRPLLRDENSCYHQYRKLFRWKMGELVTFPAGPSRTTHLINGCGAGYVPIEMKLAIYADEGVSANT